MQKAYVVTVDLSRSFKMLRKRTNPLVRYQRSHAVLVGNSLDATLVRVFASLTNNSTQRTIETKKQDCFLRTGKAGTGAILRTCSASLVMK